MAAMAAFSKGKGVGSSRIPTKFPKANIFGEVEAEGGVSKCRYCLCQIANGRSSTRRSPCGKESEGKVGEDAAVANGVGLIGTMLPGPFHGDAHELERRHGEGGDEEEDLQSPGAALGLFLGVMALAAAGKAASGILERPAESMALGVAERLLDLHSPGVDARRVRGQVYSHLTFHPLHPTLFPVHKSGVSGWALLVRRRMLATWQLHTLSAWAERLKSEK